MPADVDHPTRPPEVRASFDADGHLDRRDDGAGLMAHGEAEVLRRVLRDGRGDDLIATVETDPDRRHDEAQVDGFERALQVEVARYPRTDVEPTATGRANGRPRGDRRRCGGSSRGRRDAPGAGSRRVGSCPGLGGPRLS